MPPYSHVPPSNADRAQEIAVSARQSPTVSIWSVLDYSGPTISRDHRNVTIEVGAKHPRAVPGQPFQQGQIRVPVRVTRADADQRDRRVHGLQQMRILIQRTVVGNLQHVGAQPGRVDVVQERLLLLGFRVTDEQNRYPTADRAHQQTVVVRIRPGAGQGTGWADDPQPDLTPRERPTRSHRYHRDRGRRGGFRDGLPARSRLVEPRHDHRTDRPIAEHAGEPRHVVHMKVGDDQHRHGLHAEPAQAAVHGYRVGADVHDNRLMAGHRKHDGVALADIAGKHDRTVGRPSGGNPPQRHGAHRGRQRQHHDEAPQIRPPRRHEQPHGGRREQDPTHHAGRPRHRVDRHARPRLGQRDQPPGRPRCEPGQEFRPAGPQWREHRGPDAEQRCRGHGRRGEQIRRYRHQTDLAGQRHDDRAAGDLCGGRNGERLGQPARHTPGPKSVPPPGREQHQRARRDHR
jgi:hypothetical protein